MTYPNNDELRQEIIVLLDEYRSGLHSNAGYQADKILAKLEQAVLAVAPEKKSDSRGENSQHYCFNDAIDQYIAALTKVFKGE
jgi:hypothetical protein